MILFSSKPECRWRRTATQCPHGRHCNESLW